ncbi:hypothetical protein R6Q57_022966 [Mikania cordata]
MAPFIPQALKLVNSLNQPNQGSDGFFRVGTGYDQVQFPKLLPLTLTQPPINSSPALLTSACPIVGVPHRLSPLARNPRRLSLPCPQSSPSFLTASPSLARNPHRRSSPPLSLSPDPHRLSSALRCSSPPLLRSPALLSAAPPLIAAPPLAGCIDFDFTGDSLLDVVFLSSSVRQLPETGWISFSIS